MRIAVSLYYRHVSRLLSAPVHLTDKNGDRLSKIKIGELGERIACAKLKADHRKVLYRNYRGPKDGEVDVVTRDGSVLAFVEVKTRTRRGYGRPLDAVDAAKQELIERGANSWLKLLGTRDVPWRFDVVEVLLEEGQKPELNVVKNVF